MPLPSTYAWLADALIGAGIINQSQLEAAVNRFESSGRSTFPEILEQLDLVSSQEMARIVASHYNLPFSDLRRVKVNLAYATRLPRSRCVELGVLPLKEGPDGVEIAVANPQIYTEVDAQKDFPGKRVALMVSPSKDILGMIEEVYRGQIVVTNNADYLEQVLRDLIARDASDLHIEPRPLNVRLRARVDGELVDYAYVGSDENNSLVQAVKQACMISTSERRLPADGAFVRTIGSRRYMFRVSIVNCRFGEKATVRIQDETANLRSFRELGLGVHTEAMLKRLLAYPYGMLLFTGPTGSGKTTLMYSALATLDASRNNITTIEQPVEYVNADYNQISIDERIKDETTVLSFATILRHVLRQDPDIIMLGEIRDKDTAHVAIHAALTGHLLLSTMHTNTATGVLDRFLAWKGDGIEPVLVANSLRGAVGQRLVRKVCTKCAVPDPHAEELCAQYGLKNSGRVLSARKDGCPHCVGGYKGRIGVFEVFPFVPEVEAMIIHGAPANKIKDWLIENEGCRTLRDDGFDKVLLGVTTFEEVLSVITLE